MTTRATWQRCTSRPPECKYSYCQSSIVAFMPFHIQRVYSHWPPLQTLPNDAGMDMCQVERFDAREGHWSEVAPMAQKRGAHACTTANGHLVAIGGWDGVK